VIFLLFTVFPRFIFHLIVLISSKRRRKDKPFFQEPILASKQAFSFSAVWTCPLLCNQPCCGCNCHNIQTKYWMILLESLPTPATPLVIDFSLSTGSFAGLLVRLRSGEGKFGKK
jgi:hypothetical protein